MMLQHTEFQPPRRQASANLATSSWTQSVSVPSSRPQEQAYHKMEISLPLHHNDEDSSKAEESAMTGAKKSCVPPPFILKLYNMLETVEQDGLGHVVSWKSCCGGYQTGTCFVIHQPQEFAFKVLPRYFCLTKMTSFQRQLNLYGFQRLRNHPAVNVSGTKGSKVFYHEFFQRGQTHVLNQMVRNKVKPTATASISTKITPPITTRSSQEQHGAASFCKNKIIIVSDDDHADDQGYGQRASKESAACSNKHQDQEIWKEWGMPFFSMNYLPDGVSAVPGSPEEREQEQLDELRKAAPAPSPFDTASPGMTAHVGVDGCDDDDEESHDVFMQKVLSLFVEGDIGEEDQNHYSPCMAWRG